MRIAAGTEIRAMTMDSLRNCLINCGRFAPTTARMPISLIRVIDFAVAKLIKLKQATISKTMLIPKKI